MADVFQFSLELGKVAEELTTEQVQLMTKKLALTALERVVMRSPVDTGRFRGNWNVSVDAPDTSVSGAVDKTGQATITEGAAKIEGAGPFQAIYLSNNLAYGPALENGHSKQAPGGMVALTYAELQSMIPGE